MLQILLQFLECSTEILRKVPALITVRPTNDDNCERSRAFNPMEQLLYLVSSEQEGDALPYHSLTQDVKNGIKCSDEYKHYLFIYDNDEKAVTFFRSKYFKVHESRNPFYISPQGNSSVLFEIAGAYNKFVVKRNAIKYVEFGSEFDKFKDDVWFYPLVLQNTVKCKDNVTRPLTVINAGPYHNNIFLLMKHYNISIFSGVSDAPRVQIKPNYKKKESITEYLKSSLVIPDDYEMPKAIFIKQTTSLVVIIEFAGDYTEEEMVKVIGLLCYNKDKVCVRASSTSSMSIRPKRSISSVAPIH